MILRTLAVTREVRLSRVFGENARPISLRAFTITVMRIVSVLICLAVASLAGCNKSAAPAGSQAASSSPMKSDAVQQKLQEYAGGSAADCGRLDQRATADQSKGASDCALQASQGKKAFYVAYDMPGMSVGVAGNAEGKLFTVQAQNGSVTGADCPSQLRVASSGRVTCFAPGDMGSMSGSHSAGTVPPGMSNPHASGTKPPSN